VAHLPAEISGTLAHSAQPVFDYRAFRLNAGPSDVAELNRLIRSGATAGNEQFDAAAHLNDIIPKPWGYEYRAYADEFFDFWALHIDAPHSTSMHVHPRKLTFLICLGGQGMITGLSAQFPISAGALVRIAPGAFHSTRNTADEPLDLIEVEIPRNKLDLLRLRDKYNRAGTGYETLSLVQPECAMRKVAYLPNTHMRETAPDGRFRFELRPGMDIYYRRQPGNIFYVPLCVSGVIYSDVQILTGGGDWRPDPDKTYLCISSRG
jgi:mannose-6-phosphate isomerase-like protein (cupin superfamily)